MVMAKIGAIWRFDYKEVQAKFGYTDAVVCFISTCGKYWFGTINSGNDIYHIGKSFNVESLADINDPQDGIWAKIRNAIINDTIGMPAEGTNPYSKKREEECKFCKRIKDLGASCWWCGFK